MIYECVLNKNQLCASCIFSSLISSAVQELSYGVTCVFYLEFNFDH